MSVVAPAQAVAGRDVQPAPGPRPKRRTRLKPKAQRTLRGVAGVVIAIAVWAVVTGAELIDTSVFPTIPAFVQALADSWPDLLRSLGVTLQSWALGVSVATVLGVGLGVLVGRSFWADAFSDVVVRALRPLPSLALIPIAILIAGLGVTMTASLVAIASFWPIFINTRYAARQVEPRLLDSGRAVGLSGWSLLYRVIAPAMAPAVITGIRVAVGMAIVVTVSVQLVAGTGGLGGYVVMSQVNGLNDQVFVGAAAGGVLGLLLNNGFIAITRRLLPWSATTRGGA